MSAFRELMAKGDADHTKLSHVEFILYVSGKNTKGSGVDSDACNEYAALVSRLSEAERLLDICEKHPICPVCGEISIHKFDCGLWVFWETASGSDPQARKGEQRTEI